MTGGTDMSASDKRTGGGWLHFGIAAGILAATAIGFEWTISFLGAVTQKQAVPWPQGVIVDATTFRWQNAPDEVGKRFVLARNGELPYIGNKSSLPDGERMLDSDTLDSLGIGTGWDKSRIASRRSNWHLVRVYRDNQKPVDHPLRHWELQVYYYTGALDTVPHVPERCLVAGGFDLLDNADIVFEVPQAQSPWNGPLVFRRTRYQESSKQTLNPRQQVQYYIFSVNGKHESSWEKVRLTLSNPFTKYCYFAKIQFFPHGDPSNSKEVDLAAKEFMEYFLPVILKALPMPSDIEALKSADKPAGRPLPAQKM